MDDRPGLEAPPPADDIRSLLAYVRALDDFTRAEPAHLRPASFARLQAQVPAHLPTLRRLTARDGAQIAFRRQGPVGAAHVVVLVHGSAGYGDQMQVMAQGLANAGLACVYTLDIRGHGFSSGRPGHAVRHAAQLVEDLTDFLTFVRNAEPGAKVCLGGHSAGGGLVLALARSQADALVDSYLLLAPFLGLGCAANRPFFGGWVGLRGLTLRLVTLANLLGVRVFNAATVVDFSIGGAGPGYVANWSYDTMLAFGPGRWLGEDQPRLADKPMLVLAGSRDECFDPAQYPAAFAQFAPHARIVTLGPIGHWDLLVDHSALTELAGWLADQSLNDLTRLASRSSRSTPAIPGPSVKAAS